MKPSALLLFSFILLTPTITLAAPCTAPVDLSDEKETLLKDALKQARKQNAPLTRQMRDLKDQIHGMLVAKTFNQGAFVAASSQMEKLRAEIQINRVKAFALAAKSFTPEERERFGSFAGHARWSDDECEDSSVGQALKTTR